MKTIVLLLAHTNNEHVNCTVSPRDLRTPLHFSCAIGNLSITQLLIWVSGTEFLSLLIAFNWNFIIFQYNANLKQTDHEGRTCLTYAKASNELARVKQTNNKAHHVTSGEIFAIKVEARPINIRILFLETTNALVNLLISLGCVDTNPLCQTININNPGTITAS